jgi:hypothetical protein
MTENQKNKDNQTKQSNEGAADDRLAPMNDEQREIAIKGGKAAPQPERDAGLGQTSQQPNDGERDRSGENRPRGIQRRLNSDDEIGARGGIMGGTSARGARE